LFWDEKNFFFTKERDDLYYIYKRFCRQSIIQTSIRTVL
jgi:hypothetical protein